MTIVMCWRASPTLSFLSGFEVEPKRNITNARNTTQKSCQTRRHALGRVGADDEEQVSVAYFQQHKSN